MLKGKHILVGITGSIAAYKAAYLVRLLVKEGAEVRVLMTPAAKQFITPLTMATLSRFPVFTEFFNPENGQWNSHVSMGVWADLFLIAPASANTLSKMACGIADNLLLTTYLSARCPVMAAPAMDLDMYSHPATQATMRKLSEVGVEIIEAASGELASGLDGKGRMEEPEAIVARVKHFFGRKRSLEGTRVLITSGPTREAIDPVRYISNHSTGKMGSAIAYEFASRGAQVTVVSGPAAVVPSGENIRVMNVVSSADMYNAVMQEYSAGGYGITVLCAAVADYTPEEPALSKIKKKDAHMTIGLVPTADIAASVGSVKREGDILVGFALETDNEEENALSKLRRKNLDMIVLNSLRDSGAGFATDTNKTTMLFKDGRRVEGELKSKASVAADIVDNILSIRKC